MKLKTLLVAVAAATLVSGLALAQGRGDRSPGIDRERNCERSHDPGANRCERAERERQCRETNRETQDRQIEAKERVTRECRAK